MEAIALFLFDLVTRCLLSPWFWLAVLAALLWCILSLIYKKLKLYALEQLHYTRTLSSDGIFVGEELTLTETAQNPTWFPLLGVRLDFFMLSGVTIDDISCNEYTKLTSVFYIPPFSKVQKTHAVRADRRDHYQLQNASIQYKKNEFLFSVPIEFYAYPDQFDVGADLALELHHAGSVISDRKYIEDPFFLSGIRPYRVGDPLRSINFKASARAFVGGRPSLMCNEYDSSRNCDSMIFLDLTTYAQAPLEQTEQTETGLRLACFLFCQAVKNGGRVGFSSNCSLKNENHIYIPCQSSEMHTKTILESFACITGFAQRDYSMSALMERVAPELPTGTDVYLITPFVDAKIGAMLHSLERMGQTVCVIPLSKRSTV